MESPICQYCGSDCNGVDPSVGAHMICHVRAKHGAPTPSIGVRCSACDGTGLRRGAPKTVATNLMGLTARQFDNLVNGLHCSECKHSGVIKA